MWIRKRMYKAQAANRALEGNVNNLVLENLDNVVTIKSFRIYENVEEKYNEVLKIILRQIKSLIPMMQYFHL